MADPLPAAKFRKESFRYFRVGQILVLTLFEHIPTVSGQRGSNAGVDV